MAEGIPYVAFGSLSLLLSAALLGIASFAIITRHPQRWVVFPLYVISGLLCLWVGTRFVTHDGIGAPPVIPWALITAFSISSLWKTARVIIRGTDFRDSGLFGGR